MSSVENTLELALDRLFDHSGIFPPAAKSLEDALSDAGAFPRTLKRPNLVLTDMVVDEKRARDLATKDLRAHGFTSECRIALLAGTDTTVTADLLPILLSTRQDGIRIVVSSIECKLNNTEIIDSFVAEVASVIPNISFEPDLSGENWRDILERTVEAINKRPGVGFKARCTGQTGIGWEKLCEVIASTAREWLPLKVTGGLHHPIVERERYGNELGFLNLACAVFLRRALGASFDVNRISELLVNSEADAIRFGKTLGFKEHEITHSQLVTAKALPFSLGSCSLHEPDQDLLRLYGPPVT